MLSVRQAENNTSLGPWHKTNPCGLAFRPSLAWLLPLHFFPCAPGLWPHRLLLQHMQDFTPKNPCQLFPPGGVYALVPLTVGCPRWDPSWPCSEDTSSGKCHGSWVVLGTPSSCTTAFCSAFLVPVVSVLQSPFVPPLALYAPLRTSTSTLSLHCSLFWPSAYRCTFVILRLWHLFLIEWKYFWEMPTSHWASFIKVLLNHKWFEKNISGSFKGWSYLLVDLFVSFTLVYSNKHQRIPFFW